MCAGISEGNLLARAVSLGDLCPYAARLKFAASCTGNSHQSVVDVIRFGLASLPISLKLCDSHVSRWAYRFLFPCRWWPAWNATIPSIPRASQPGDDRRVSALNAAAWASRPTSHGWAFPWAADAAAGHGRALSWAAPGVRHGNGGAAGPGHAVSGAAGARSVWSQSTCAWSLAAAAPPHIVSAAPATCSACPPRTHHPPSPPQHCCR